jgi:adhesin/invasin
MLPLGRFAIAAAAASLLLAACGDSTSPPRPTTLAAVSSVQVVGTVGELLSEPLTVRVTDAGGSPVARVPVTFTVAEGGGSLSRTLDSTDASGVARTSWRLGETAGAQRVTAVAAGLSGTVEFRASAQAGAPATIAIATGDNQTAAAGAPVPTPPAVRIRDRFNNPVAGVSVFFSVSSGGGSVGGAGAVTNADGIATVGEWRLGPAVGQNRLAALAVVNGVAGNPVTFTALATAGAAARVVATTATAITGTVGASVTPVPQVRVTDANGNPVAGVSVAFAASTGSTVANATQVTSADGVASATSWTLGTTAQDYTLTATVAGLAPVTFTGTARPGPAANVVAQAGDNQTAQVGRTLPVEPAVRVTDAFGNAVAGVEVLFEVTAGGGTVLGRRPATNASGVAAVGAWTLGETIGTNTLRASVQASNVAGNPLTFTAIATSGPAVSMAVSAGQGQTATVGSAVAVRPAVIVRDSRGNPVAGVTVTFAVGAGGGTVTGATAVTSAAGVATVGSWTLGGVAGVQTLVASAAGLTDVTFSATATAGAAATLAAFSTTNLGSFVVAASQAVSQLPSVRVTDVGGNPVAGVTVTFATANSASGSIGGNVQVTNANGVATLGSWTLPTTAGTATVVASVPGLTDVSFQATMLPAAASRIVLVGTVPSTVTQATTTALSLSFRLQDAFFNNVSTAGVTVTFTPGTGSGTVSSATATTNGSGVVTVTWTFATPATPPADQTQTLVVAGGTGSGLTGLTVAIVVQ